MLVSSIAILFFLSLGMLIYSERQENNLTLVGVIRKYKGDIFVAMIPVAFILLLMLIVAIVP